MSQKSDVDLQTQRAEIENETGTGLNTAVRVGQMFEDAIDSKINNDKIVDEDDMVSDSATLVPTQQSVKAYVDAQAGGSGHTIEDEGTPLTARSKLNFVGAGVTATDDSGDDASDITIPGILSEYVLDQASASTAGATITLDMNSQKQRSFVGSATFATPKTLALSNTTNSLFFNVFFEVTNVAAVITMPSDFLMSSIDWDGTDWTPPTIGKYEFGGSFDDTNNLWYLKVSGPFT